MRQSLKAHGRFLAVAGAMALLNLVAAASPQIVKSTPFGPAPAAAVSGCVDGPYQHCSSNCEGKVEICEELSCNCLHWHCGRTCR